MARQNAKELLIKIETSAGAGTFVSLGMLKTSNFTIATNAIDATNKDTTDGQSEADVGTQKLSASGDMFFDAGAGQARLRSAVAAKEKPLMQIIDPGAGTYQGTMIVTSFGKSGGFEGSVESNFQIENAAPWTFTAE